MFFVTFFVSFFLSTLSFIKGNHRLFISLFLIVGLTLFAGTRIEGIDNDYLEYKNIFTESVTSNIDASFFLIREPAFYLIPQFFLFFFGLSYFLQATFLFFAILGVSTKIVALRNSNAYFLSVVLYVSYVFFYQEMITIRAGVACGFFLLAIEDLVYKNQKRYFSKVAMAMFFHYSSFIFFLVWFLVNLRIKIKSWYAFLVVSLLVAFFKINVLTLLKLDVLVPKVKLYLDLLEVTESEPLNVFNYKILFSLGILVLFSMKYKILDKLPFFSVLFKIHILSLSLFFLLSPTAMVFSLRIFDLLSIIQLLLFPMIITVFKERFVGYFVIVSYAFVNLLYILIVSDLFNEYSSWLF